MKKLLLPLVFILALSACSFGTVTSTPAAFPTPTTSAPAVQPSDTPASPAPMPTLPPQPTAVPAPISGSGP